MSREEFESLTLFEAYDLEHSAMISAGIPTRWPEEAQAEEEEIDAELKAVLARRVTRNQGN